MAQKNIAFTVVGKDRLHCEGCEERVDRALKRLSGVREVEADHKTQRIEVVYDQDQVSSKQIEEKLDLLGYEVESGGSSA